MSEFKKTYEKAPGKMTQQEFKIATVGLLNTIMEKQDVFEEAMIERLDKVNGKVQLVERHKIYFRLIGAVTGFVLLPVLVWLIIRTFT